ncbi:Serine Threonine protein kinase [Klebsormidium nitens]|uniref:Serine Threonine protein kinase n=1 Tax=Klebsormidium nitens TaxID=105231 RepID=A0A1Y1IHA5_KLENI|nr:Serine Threonine protein kinase [Klebsormidium nitens]|eukprot:GAQ90250.1 Serine Threonine protein kinase [Klebsormidium nitens]
MASLSGFSNRTADGASTSYRSSPTTQRLLRRSRTWDQDFFGSFCRDGDGIRSPGNRLDRTASLGCVRSSLAQDARMESRRWSGPTLPTTAPVPDLRIDHLRRLAVRDTVEQEDEPRRISQVRHAEELIGGAAFVDEFFDRKPVGVARGLEFSSALTQQIPEYGAPPPEEFGEFAGQNDVPESTSGLDFDIGWSKEERRGGHPGFLLHADDDDQVVWARKMLRRQLIFKQASLKSLHDIASRMVRRPFVGLNGVPINDKNLERGLYLITEGTASINMDDNSEAPFGSQTFNPEKEKLLFKGAAFGSVLDEGVGLKEWPGTCQSGPVGLGCDWLRLGKHTAEDNSKVKLYAGPGGMECLFISELELKTILRRDWFTQVPEGAPLQNMVPDVQQSKLSNYRYIDMLGAGGFGHVGLVEHKSTGGVFALKWVPREPCKDACLKSEIQLLSGLSSPFVGKYVKHFLWQGSTYLLQEVMLGGDFQQLVKEHNDTLSEQQAKFYVACMVEALGYLQSQGIAHRDIKLANFLVDDEGYLKLVDFGYAAKLPKGKSTRARVGTPSYVAPEIVRGFAHDGSVDLWSLGVALHRMLTGVCPFGDAPKTPPAKVLQRIKDKKPPQFPESLSADAKNLITRLLQHESGDRLGWGDLGIEEIRAHPWFAGFEWEKLRRRELEAPFLPKIAHPWDTTRFHYRGTNMNKMILPEEKEQCKPTGCGFEEHAFLNNLAYSAV